MSFSHLIQLKRVFHHLKLYNLWSSDIQVSSITEADPTEYWVDLLPCSSTSGSFLKALIHLFILASLNIQNLKPKIQLRLRIQNVFLFQDIFVSIQKQNALLLCLIIIISYGILHLLIWQLGSACSVLNSIKVKQYNNNKKIKILIHAKHHYRCEECMLNARSAFPSS